MHLILVASSLWNSVDPDLHMPVAIETYRKKTLRRTCTQEYTETKKPTEMCKHNIVIYKLVKLLLLLLLLLLPLTKVYIPKVATISWQINN